MAVSKEKIKDAIYNCDIKLTWFDWAKLVKAIDECADEPATAPSASWLVDSWDNETDPGKVAMIVRCSNCGYPQDYLTDFCPNCGSLMEENDEMPKVW